MVRLSTAPLRALRSRPTAQPAVRYAAPALSRSFFLSSPRLKASAPSSQPPAAGAGLQGNVDMMTGEVIRTPDIDVSSQTSLSFLIGMKRRWRDQREIL